MNQTIDLLMKRKSVRQYTDQPISPDERQAILDAAMRAPTAGNMMLYSILEITDQELKQQLAVTCDNQPFIATAPLVLIFLADYQRWFDYYQSCGAEDLAKQKGIQPRQPAEGDLLLACCDALIAAHAACVAAEAMGIGSCYIGDILERYETHQQLLNLPPYAVPVTMLCFGHPTRSQIDRQMTSRFPEPVIVHQNGYHHMSAAELEQMFAESTARLMEHGKRTDGVENFGQFNYLRKFTSEFSIEMNRSVRAMLDAWNRGG